MTHETSKSMVRRLHDVRFVTRYFVGNGLNVGAGNDHLSFYGSLFPLMKNVKEWDLADGDGMLLETVEDESYDFLHASHNLEHLKNPEIALMNWIRVVKAGGHLIITVPDEDLFEQGIWPSFPSGKDHITGWTIGKNESWCPDSWNVMEFLSKFLDDVAVLKIELIDRMYLYDKDPMDQTQLPGGHECAIEIILRKKTDFEKKAKGNLTPNKLTVAANIKEQREKQAVFPKYTIVESQKQKKESDATV